MNMGYFEPEHPVQIALHLLLILFLVSCSLPNRSEAASVEDPVFTNDEVILLRHPGSLPMYEPMRVDPNQRLKIYADTAQFSFSSLRLTYPDFKPPERTFKLAHRLESLEQQERFFGEERNMVELPRWFPELEKHEPRTAGGRSPHLRTFIPDGLPEGHMTTGPPDRIRSRIRTEHRSEPVLRRSFQISFRPGFRPGKPTLQSSIKYEFPEPEKFYFVTGRVEGISWGKIYVYDHRGGFFDPYAEPGLNLLGQGYVNREGEFRIGPIRNREGWIYSGRDLVVVLELSSRHTVAYRDIYGTRRVIRFVIREQKRVVPKGHFVHIGTIQPPRSKLPIIRSFLQWTRRLIPPGGRRQKRTRIEYVTNLSQPRSRVQKGYVYVPLPSS